MFFIYRIIDDRGYSYNNIVEEIGNEWGIKQTIAGVFLKYLLKTAKHIMIIQETR